MLLFSLYICGAFIYFISVDLYYASYCVINQIYPNKMVLERYLIFVKKNNSTKVK